MSLFSHKKKKAAPPPPPKAGRMAPKPEVAEEGLDESPNLMSTVTAAAQTPMGKAVLGVLALWSLAMYLHTRKR